MTDDTFPGLPSTGMTMTNFKEFYVTSKTFRLTFTHQIQLRKADLHFLSDNDAHMI
jgi:hypothetical protein